MRKLYLAICAVFISLLTFSQTVSIGNGTVTNGTSPWNSYYGYSYVQSIYLQSEISASGSITSISYYYAGSSLDNSNDVTVYMGHTTKSGFSSATDWEPVNNLTQVFSGVLTGYTIPGWVTIDLTTPFVYNDTDNLVIAVDENLANYDGSVRFNGTEHPGSSRVLAYFNDATNPKPASPPAGQVEDIIGNIQISGLTLLGCQAVSGVNVSSITFNSAVAAWTAPTGGSAINNYNWEVRTSGPAGSGTSGLVSKGNVDTVTVNLSSLSPGTSYNFYVRTNCGSTKSAWSDSVKFFTPCLSANLPYHQNFESATVPDLPPCTSIENAGTGNDWEIINAPGSGFTSNTLAYEYNSSSAADAWFYTQGLNLTAGTSYRLSFKYGNNSTSYHESLDAKFGTSPSSTEMNDEIVSLPDISLNGSALSATDFTVSVTGVYYIGFHANSIANQYNLFVDDIALTITPTCDAPDGVTASNMTTTGAQVDWTPPSVSTPIGYQIYYSTNSATPADSVTAKDSTADVTFNLTNLSAGTTYYVWVRSNCGNGDLSAWSVAGVFTTVCDAVSSFTETFDEVTVPAFPNCWSQVGTDGSTAIQDADAYSSPNALYIFSNSTSEQAVVAMHAVNNLADGTHRLKFKARANFTTGGVVEVGYLTDPTDATSFTPIESITANSLSYQDYTITPGNIQGAEVLAFRHTGDPANSVLIDNVAWEEIPACDVPTGVVISGISETGAQADWTAPSVSIPASYDAFLSTNSTEPDSTTLPTVTGISGTTTTFTALTANTRYFFWVRSNCGNGYSIWSSVDSFSTLCNPVSTLPWTENFDGTTEPDLPSCFTAINNNSDEDQWQTYSGYGTGGSMAAGLNTDFNFGSNDDYLVLPSFTLTGHQRFRFSVRARSASEPNDFHVVLSTTNADPASFTDELLPLTTVSSTTQTPIDWIDLSAYTGKVYIAVQVPPGGLDGYYLYVDDMILEDIPACAEPSGLTSTNITSSSAQLDWNLPASGTPSGYELYYSTSNTAPSDSTVPVVTGLTNTTYLLDSLSANTEYYSWVRSNCGGGNVSAWSLADSFSTTCAAVTAFSENFDSVTDPSFPGCWFKVGTSGSASTQSSDAFSDPNTLYMYSSSTTDQAVVSLPPVSNLAAGTNRLKFKARANFTAGGVIEVGYLTDPSNASTFTPIESITANDFTYQDFIITPGPIQGAEVLAFRHTGDPANSVLIDDVAWEAIPSCSEPQALAASNITSSGAVINWDAPSAGTPVSYDVYYSTSNTAPSDSTLPVIAGVTGNSVALDSLDTNTPYYVWVRTNCTAADQSAWSSSLLFSTTCAIVAAPSAVEPFSGDIPGDCWSAAKGILGDPTTFTGTSSSWVSDNFANRTAGGNLAARINIYGTTRNEWLISPSYDLGTAGNLQMEFDLALTQYSDTTAADLGSDDKFTVLISTDNGTTWSAANTLRQWDASTPISDTGEHIIIDLASYTGIVKFAFYGESTLSNEDNDLFVDNFAIALSGPLPVTMTSFKGHREGSKNVLTWTTKTEHNNKGFELQRSADGTTFNTLDFVSSKAADGNSTVQLSYQYFDLKPFIGNSYYRLKQIDKDGKETLSDVVLIKGTNASTIVLSNVYPNPAKSQLNLTIFAPGNDKVTLFITDAAGKVVLKQATQLSAGDNKISIPVNKILSGVYIIKAICASGCEAAVTRFIKE